MSVLPIDVMCRRHSRVQTCHPDGDTRSRCTTVEESCTVLVAARPHVRHDAIVTTRGARGVVGVLVPCGHDPVIRRVGTARLKSRPCRVRTRANTAIVVPTCDARGARESREGFVADGRTPRRSSPPRDTGASLRPCDVWVSTSFAADRCDVRSHCSVDTRDGILLTPTCRSASRDPRRRLARVRVHPVRPDRVPSRARPGHGGAPA